jgi:hypothetical protein
MAAISAPSSRKSASARALSSVVALSLRSSHKRLILIATITLMEAAINRWPHAIIERAPFMIDVFAYTFLLVLVANDLWSMWAVHRATIWGGLFLVVMQQLELPIGKTAVWQGFAARALERAKSIHRGREGVLSATP